LQEIDCIGRRESAEERREHLVGGVLKHAELRLGVELAQRAGRETKLDEHLEQPLLLARSQQGEELRDVGGVEPGEESPRLPLLRMTQQAQQQPLPLPLGKQLGTVRGER
jgi:hypothetical protein